MNSITLEELNKIRPQKIGNIPVVILPLEYFELLKEDLEMYRSKKLPGEISKARKEKKTISLDRMLGKYNL